MAPLHDDGGATPPPSPSQPLRPLPWRERLLVWAVLQLAAGAALATASLLVASIAPLFGPGGASFLRQWSTAFLVLPLTFVPALVIWHRWALRRFGKRGTLFRIAAELAFAVEVVGCVLIQNIA